MTAVGLVAMQQKCAEIVWVYNLFSDKKKKEKKKAKDKQAQQNRHLHFSFQLSSLPFP